MVKETRIAFEVKDIVAFRVQCKKCCSEITLRLDSDKGSPDECPMCKEPKWVVGSGGYELLTALRRVSHHDPKDGSTIHLEIHSED